MGYGNYAGDVLNFSMAAELAAAEGIDVREIRVNDDVASAPRAERSRRRRDSGGRPRVQVHRRRRGTGDGLDAVERVGRRANDATLSVGIALTACEVPGSGGATFSIGPDEMEIGMGIHGEPGIRREPLQPADAVAASIVEAIVADVEGGVGGRELALLVNGLGATETLDQYILYRAARRELEAVGATIARSYVGEFVTSLEMSGASVTVMLLDDELRALLDAPTRTPRLVR